MLTLLKFNTVTKLFQCDGINIPDINILQRKMPVRIVLIVAAEGRVISSACCGMFSCFLLRSSCLEPHIIAIFYLCMTYNWRSDVSVSYSHLSKEGDAQGEREERDRDGMCPGGSAQSPSAIVRDRQTDSSVVRLRAWKVREEGKGTFGVGLTQNKVPQISERSIWRRLSATKWCYIQRSIFVVPRFTRRNKPEHCQAD